MGGRKGRWREGSGGYSREAIFSNISIIRGDLSIDGYYSRKYGTVCQTLKLSTVIIYKKKLLNSDWLREEFSSSVTRVQITTGS